MSKNTYISLRALNKDTGEYVFPRMANKKHKYICPDCKGDLIFRNGIKNIAHFAHKRDDNPCKYYTHPSETQLHKDAKSIIKKLFDDNIPFKILCHCSLCHKDIIYSLPKFSTKSTAKLEHIFTYNGIKIADVAIIDDINKNNVDFEMFDGKKHICNFQIVCIFEICNTHKTNSENRPEPWFEIDALTLIKIVNEFDINNLNKNDLIIPCIRKNDLCNKCRYLVQYQNESVDILNELYLDVSYNDKEKFKKLGGKWNSIIKKWYILRDNRNMKKILEKYKTTDIKYLIPKQKCRNCAGSFVQYMEDDDWMMCIECFCKTCAKPYTKCTCSCEYRDDLEYLNDAIELSKILGNIDKIDICYIPRGSSFSDIECNIARKLIKKYNL